MSEIIDPIGFLLLSQAKLQRMLGMEPHSLCTSVRILGGLSFPTWISDEFLRSFGCVLGKCLRRESCGQHCLPVSTVKMYPWFSGQWNYYTFAKTYRMYNTKGEPYISYGFWVMMACDAGSSITTNVPLCWGMLIVGAASMCGGRRYIRTARTF